MASSSAPSSDNPEHDDVQIDALLSRIDAIKASRSPALRSVPDLEDDALDATEPDSASAAIDPAPVELSLVPNDLDDSVEDDSVEDDSVEEVSSAPEHSMPADAASENPLQEPESSQVAEVTEEKIDHFANMDDGVKPRIAGVQSEPTRPKIEQQELLRDARFDTVRTDDSVEFDTTDKFGTLADPLDIQDVVPSHPDGDEPEQLLNHGVIFPAIVAGAPWAKGMRARPGDLPVEDTSSLFGELPLRLVLASALLCCLIGLAVVQLNDPSNVAALRDVLSGLFA